MRLRMTTYMFFCSLLFTSCATDSSSDTTSQQTDHYYTCPMHPEVIRDKPGKCPICGMELVKKKIKSLEKTDTSLSFILKPANEYVLAQQPGVKLKDTVIQYALHASGIITYDLQNTNTIAARVNGRIEHLYVKTNFQPVRIGDKLLDIYSRDLVAAQQDYLLLTETDSTNHALISAAEQKLLLLGVTPLQLQTIRQTKKPFEYVSVYSNYAGHLHEGAETPTNSMGTVDNTQNLREGMYVQKGQTLFRIYDTRSVWAVLNINSASVRKGDSLKIFVEGIEDSLAGKVLEVEPEYRASLTSATVRVRLDNKNNALKIGAAAEGTFSKTKKMIVLPRSSVLRLGQQDVVFVARRGFFIPIAVSTGMHTETLVEISEGLAQTEKVALNAQALIDSESFIKVESNEK